MNLQKSVTYNYEIIAKKNVITSGLTKANARLSENICQMLAGEGFNRFSNLIGLSKYTPKEKKSL